MTLLRWQLSSSYKLALSAIKNPLPKGKGFFYKYSAEETYKACALPLGECAGIMILFGESVEVVGSGLIDEVVEPVLVEEICVAAPSDKRLFAVVIIGEIVIGHVDG